MNRRKFLARILGAAGISLLPKAKGLDRDCYSGIPGVWYRNWSVSADGTVKCVTTAWFEPNTRRMPLVPKPPDGFQRVHSAYALRADGSLLSVSLKDEESLTKKGE